MSAFKTLLTSDIVVTPFVVNKQFTFEGTAALTASNVGIDRFYGNYLPKIDINSTTYQTGQITTQSRGTVYNSIKQLYYSNYSESRYRASGSFENYLATTLDVSVENAMNIVPSQGVDRYFPFTSSYDGSTVGVISIPTKLYGEYIQPGTVRLKTTTASIADDGQGNLYNTQTFNNVGTVIYNHGLAIITINEVIGVPVVAEYGTARYGANSVYSSAGGTGVYLIPELVEGNLTCSFQSAITIYETQIKCNISPSEFTTTLNPTIFQGTGSVYDFATGSYFAPYITTVGLYNDNQELLAVAKLAQEM